MPEENDWNEVDRYAQQRQNETGDVYGWFRSEHEGARVAVILAAESSVAASFPREIAGIRVVVKNVSAPERQS